MSIEQLRKITMVQTDEKILDHYSKDASIFEVKPQAVAFPTSVDELSALVKYIRSELESGSKTSLTPRNAGSCMSGGSLTQDVMVDMTGGFSWVGDIDMKTRRVWVGGGTLFRDIDAKTREVGLMFAPYTSSRDFCGIGGMIGNNASGEKSIRFGATIDNIHAIRVVLQDGKEYEFGPLNAKQLHEKMSIEGHEGAIYRSVVKLLEENWDLLWARRPKVRKNAAGYQLWKIWDRDKTEFNLARLFVGAQGTLGFVTAAELQLQPIPEYTRMMVVAIEDLSGLAKAVKSIVAHNPEGVETYDKHTYELAKQFMPEEAALAHLAAGQEMVLIAQFSEHTKDRTDHAEDVAQRALRRQGFEVRTVRSEAEAEAHWAIRRASYGLLKDHAKHGRAVPFLEDTIVNIDHYGEFLASLEAILADYEMTYTFAGHIGDGSIRLIPIVDMEKPDAVEKVFSLARRVYDLVFAFGGSMSVDHNDGLIRTAFLGEMYGPEINSLFEATKDIFDPLNMFNPGKKVRGDMEYAKSHMSRTNEKYVAPTN